MGPDNCPIGLRRFQFGGKALRPDGLLGVVLPSLIFLAKELANEFFSALRNTREGGPSELGESEEEEVSSLCKDWRSKPGKNVVIKR